MGRPSKLTEAQWAEVHQRIIKGEKPADLAREFGISKTRISERFSGRFETVKAVANQLLTAEQAFQSLPIAEQIETVSVLNDMREITRHIGGAARLSAATSHRLAAIANTQVEKVDDSAPMTPEGFENLKTVAALTEMANKAAHIPLNLIAANKEMIKDLSQQAKPIPQRVTVMVEDASVPDAQAQ